MQHYTSENTDVNGMQNKLPKLFNLVSFETSNTVFDYGCGRNTYLPNSKVSEYGCRYVGYDPYNKSKDDNSKAMEILYSGCKYGVCSNVLNVIDCIDEIKRIVNELTTYCEECYFTFYEGDGSGIGCPTGNDQYQRNEKTQVYVERFRSWGYDAKRKGKLVIIKKEREAA